MSDATDAKIAQIRSDIAARDTVDASVLALLHGLTAQIADLKAKQAAAGATPEQLAALDEFDASLKKGTADLVAAVSENTQTTTGGNASGTLQPGTAQGQPIGPAAGGA